MVARTFNWWPIFVDGSVVSMRLHAHIYTPSVQLGAELAKLTSDKLGLFSWKSLLYPLTMGVDYLTSNYETVYSTPELSKTGQITPRRIRNGGFTTVTVVLPLHFILAESLKNHNKSQKNYKNRKSNLLDST
jgi:hypothetical protein